MMRNYFERMFGSKKKSFVFTTRSLGRETGNGMRVTNATESHISGDFITMDTMAWGNSVMSSTGSVGVGKSVPKGDERKSVEPKEVFEEIKRETPEISFNNLPEKIASVEERLKILSEHLDEHHLADEHRTLFYLKNRLKYLKTQAKNPLDWALTTQGAVEDLCKSYQLKVVPLKQYYTLVPKDGLAEMKRYTKAYKAITGDTPIFELVIKDIPEEKKEEARQQRRKDRDPILLANSPLGNFMFILGAWDEEVEIVDEIIYGFK